MAAHQPLPFRTDLRSGTGGRGHVSRRQPPWRGASPSYRRLLVSDEGARQVSNRSLALGQPVVSWGEPEVQRLLDEHANRQHGLAKGAAVVWHELESAKADGIDLRKLVTVPEGTYRQPNISDLVHSVARLREEHQVGRGVALVAYELTYRTESNSDVHISFDLLARYLADFTASGATVLRRPGADDVNDLRGPLSASGLHLSR